MDRLKLCAALLAVLTAVGCDHEGPPQRLLHGEHAARFAPVRDGVLTQARALARSDLGARLRGRGVPVFSNSVILERIGVFGESVTVLNGNVVYACDGGVDPAGERRPPWCGFVVGRLIAGRLLDPRLDILCEDRDHERLAYAFVTPLPAASWIGVDQGTYTELYEVLGGLPVRVATTRRIDAGRSSATFEVTQYAAHGRLLVAQELEAAVAG